MKYLYLCTAIGFYETMAGILLYLEAGWFPAGAAAVWGLFFPVISFRIIKWLKENMPEEKDAEIDPENRELFLSYYRKLGNDILTFERNEKWNGCPPTLVKERNTMEKEKQHKNKVQPKKERRIERPEQSAVEEAKFLIEQEKRLRARENKRQMNYYLMINRANSLLEKKAWKLAKVIFEECLERAESEFEQRYCRNKIELCEVRIKGETSMEK